ncbi:cardiolipin synthase [Paenibacillus pectinilyticus]|uniref:Cardiolipin synthase n=1 Tax=Paenibacillus pectinilyticus TaxID=512399 RepID=A0A1C0ZSX2_9BACL|nr:cardiolipin synthase [Paenibacillus pectinilyticus]OCT11157.1 cardiolipin synthase [Paenibacillus pectinilyticus]
MIWIIVILLLFIFQAATILISEYKRPAKTVAWLSILFIFPIIGFVMYYFIAREYSRRKKVHGHGTSGQSRHTQVKISSEELMGKDSFLPEDLRLRDWLRRVPDAPITPNNQVKVLTNADTTYEHMLQEIAKARSHIHFEFYTIRDDAVGLKFQEALIRKAKEGVTVRVIYDGMGSHTLTQSYIDTLKQAGIAVHPFLKPLISFFDKRLNYRNHRKIIVVDGLVGFVGGINIGIEYVGGNPKLGFWRDTHLMIHGDAVNELQRTFLTDWLFVSGEKLTAEAQLYPVHKEMNPSLVQVISSGPDTRWDAIQEMYFAGLITAKNRIWVTTPYFIPDPSIIMALKSAAISGVDVRIILPYKGDSRIVQYASRSYLQELLQAGVRFYLYRKGFIHAKIILIDELMATVGTANMDMRSFFSNFELNAVMFDEEIIQRLERDFVMDLEECTEVKLEEFVMRSKMEKRKEAIAHLLSPLF